MRIRKSRYIESNQTCCCTGKFNAVLSLCRVLGITLYFSEGFLKVAARILAVAEAQQPYCGLLLRIEVQLIVFCTTIEVQVVFNEMLLVLVTGQLAIAGQLGKEVHLWSIRLLLESGRWR